VLATARPGAAGTSAARFLVGGRSVWLLGHLGGKASGPHGVGENAVDNPGSDEEFPPELAGAARGLLPASSDANPGCRDRERGGLRVDTYFRHHRQRGPVHALQMRLQG
jgi:hypothetical protein